MKELREVLLLVFVHTICRSRPSLSSPLGWKLFLSARITDLAPCCSRQSAHSLVVVQRVAIQIDSANKISIALGLGIGEIRKTLLYCSTPNSTVQFLSLDATMVDANDDEQEMGSNSSLFLSRVVKSRKRKGSTRTTISEGKSRKSSTRPPIPSFEATEDADGTVADEWIHKSYPIPSFKANSVDSDSESDDSIISAPPIFIKPRPAKMSRSRSAQKSAREMDKHAKKEKNKEEVVDINDDQTIEPMDTDQSDDALMEAALQNVPRTGGPYNIEEILRDFPKTTLKKKFLKERLLDHLAPSESKIVESVSSIFNSSDKDATIKQILLKVEVELQVPLSSRCRRLVRKQLTDLVNEKEATRVQAVQADVSQTVQLEDNRLILIADSVTKPRKKPVPISKTGNATGTSLKPAAGRKNDNSGNQRKVSRKRCKLCTSCPCTSWNPIKKTLPVIKGSDVSKERALIKRLQSIERQLDELEQGAESIRRALKKHRRDLWKRRSERASGAQEETMFLPDAENMDPHFGCIGNEKGTGLSIKAKQSVFSDRVEQPTLTQLFQESSSTGQNHGITAEDSSVSCYPLIQQEDATVDSENACGGRESVWETMIGRGCGVQIEECDNDEGMDELLGIWEEQPGNHTTIFQLSQGAQSLAFRIESEQEATAGRFSEECPTWKENVHFALREKSIDALVEARERVIDMEQRCNAKREVVYKRLNQQCACLSFYNSLLRRCIEYRGSKCDDMMVDESNQPLA